MRTLVQVIENWLLRLESVYEKALKSGRSTAVPLCSLWLNILFSISNRATKNTKITKTTKENSRCEPRTDPRGRPDGGVNPVAAEGRAGWFMSFVVTVVRLPLVNVRLILSL
jgi:hypothetical protein